MIAFLSPLAFALGWLFLALIVATAIATVVAIANQSRYERRFARARAEYFARRDRLARARSHCDVLEFPTFERTGEHW